MTVWNRLGDALQTGIEAGVQTWRGDNVYPLFGNDRAWDTWESRLERYQQYEYYYISKQYSDINRLSLLLKEQGRLYVNVRSIYNPVYRMVNLYADKVYPAMIDFNDLTKGAIPVVGSPQIRDSLKRLFRWSNWNAEKQLYVRTGEKLGDTFIRIVDDIDSKRVLLEVLLPQKVQYLKKDSAGNIKEIWITYYLNEDRPTALGTPDLKRVRIREEITPDHVIIYENDKKVDEWENPFGFVPVVHVKPIDEGFVFGDTRWDISRSLINEINSQAALLNDQVRKAIIPYIATIGGKIDGSALTRSNKTMDELINIAVGLGGDVKMIAPQIDIASALKNIESQLNELRENNPELFMYQLADMSLPPSGVALRQFFDLGVNKITGAQGIYDDALIRACQMALTIGGVQGYQDFPYTIQSFEAGDLDFTFKTRDVIYDAIPETTRINYLMSSGAPQSAVWTALGVSDEDQENWRTELETQNEQAIQAQIDQYNEGQRSSTGQPTNNISGSPSTET